LDDEDKYESEKSKYKQKDKLKNKDYDNADDDDENDRKSSKKKERNEYNVTQIFFTESYSFFFIFKNGLKTKDYDDDFEDDFQSDNEQDDTNSNKVNTSKKKSSSRTKNYTPESDEEDKPVNKVKHKEKNSRRKYSDESEGEDEGLGRGRVVKANALVHIPTDSVQVFSSKIFFNHDSLDRQSRRAKDLLKTIELDKKSFNLLDINPIEMRTIYSSHLKHVSIMSFQLITYECKNDLWASYLRKKCKQMMKTLK